MNAAPMPMSKYRKRKTVCRTHKGVAAATAGILFCNFVISFFRRDRPSLPSEPLPPSDDKDASASGEGNRGKAVANRNGVVGDRNPIKAQPRLWMPAEVARPDVAAAAAITAIVAFIVLHERRYFGLSSSCIIRDTYLAIYLSRAWTGFRVLNFVG
eukprot:6196552-Pleurochrysis_carterae.AAC.3